MAIINLNLDLDKIDKSRIVEGKKGRYLDITVSTYDKADQFGKNVNVYHRQSKEEWKSDAEKLYLGKGNVVAGGMVVKVEQEQPKEESSSVDFDFI